MTRNPIPFLVLYRSVLKRYKRITKTLNNTTILNATKNLVIVLRCETVRLVL